MTSAAVLVLMHALAARAPDARLQPIADAIAAVASDADEAAELVALAWVETGLGRAGVPFGLSCCARRGMTLAEIAARAAVVLRQGRAACGPALAARHHYYRVGRCGADDEARRRARLVRRLTRVAAV